MNGMVKAFRLEINDLFGSLNKAIPHFFIPIAIVVLLAEAGASECAWCYYNKTTYTYFNFYTSLIFSTAMLFIAMQLMVLRIVGERAPYGTLDRDLLAISRSGMYLGKFTAGLVVAAIQCVLLILVGGMYGMIFIGSLLDFFITLFILSAVGLALGMLFSVASKSKEQAVQLVPFAVLVFLTLSGDLILLSDMPSILTTFAKNSPVTIANEILREIMLGGHGILDFINKIEILMIWTGVLLALGILKFNTEKK
jgi:ABC-type multidrug transport system permease subunit